MEDKVVFHLKRFWVIKSVEVDLYEEIKVGRKKIEYRDASFYWSKLLLSKPLLIFDESVNQVVDLTEFLKVARAWFVVGYPKNSLPRLEADITKLEYDPAAEQFRIHFDNVVEVTA